MSSGQKCQNLLVDPPWLSYLYLKNLILLIKKLYFSVLVLLLHLVAVFGKRSQHFFFEKSAIFIFFLVHTSSTVSFTPTFLMLFI